MVDKSDHLNMIKITVDTISAVFTVGALLQLLPAIAAALSIFWYCIRIWESKTVQGWLGRTGETDNGD